MGVILRSCTPELALALQGNLKLWSADSLQIALSDGVTTLFWTTWSSDLTISGQVYSSKKPWINRSKWSVENSMTVATMDLKITALNDAFSGGAQLKTQLYNGLFDGATVLLSRAFMKDIGDTTALGTIDLFGGDVGAIDITGLECSMKVKSKINRLDMQTPRNFFKVSCLHGFCDVGCTLLRASFTTSHTVGTSPAPSRFFIPWDTPPAIPTKFVSGTVAFTSGQNTGSRRNVANADSSGLYFVYPLPYTPVVGDGFTAFEGCNKAFFNGGVQDCTARANTQHYRGFEFTPPPLATA